MRSLLFALVVLALPGFPLVSRAALAPVSKDPYLGAIVLDAATGQVLFADQADAVGYPASVLKLMDLLVILDKVQQGVVRFDDRVTVTAEASKIGGSQVYLAEKETFTVDELLYALMIQSANDAATALAIRLGGSKDGFVQLMNEKAQALGMRQTRFTSVHGLPPGEGQQPDVTTARDLAVLCRELAKYPDAFRYTSTQVRGFRNNTFEMRNHNKLLGAVEGVDGFKTGYYRAAGFSTAVTAQRDGVRIIVVVLGSVSKEVRDAKAAELLARGFLAVPRPAVQPASPAVAAPAPAPVAAAVVGATEEEEAGSEEEAGPAPSGGGWGKLVLGIVIGAGAAVGVLLLLNRRPRDDKADLLRR